MSNFAQFYWVGTAPTGYAKRRAFAIKRYDYETSVAFADRGGCRLPSKHILDEVSYCRAEGIAGMAARVRRRSQPRGQFYRAF